MPRREWEEQHRIDLNDDQTNTCIVICIQNASTRNDQKALTFILLFRDPFSIVKTHKFERFTRKFSRASSLIPSFADIMVIKV